jgi:hypothetical protein
MLAEGRDGVRDRPTARFYRSRFFNHQDGPCHVSSWAANPALSSVWLCLIQALNRPVGDGVG